MSRCDPRAELEVVDLLERGLLARQVLVMLVWRIRRPVPGRREDLDGNDAIRLDGMGGAEAVDLARARAGPPASTPPSPPLPPRAANFDRDVLCAQMTQRQSTVAARGRQCETSTVLAAEGHGGVARYACGIGDAAPDIRAPLQVDALPLGLDAARSREREDDDLLVFGVELVTLASVQPKNAQPGELPACAVRCHHQLVRWLCHAPGPQVQRFIDCRRHIDRHDTAPERTSAAAVSTADSTSSSWG